MTTGAVNHTRRRRVERRDHARNRRPRDPVPARERRGAGIGVDHVRSRHRRRPQRARDGAPRRRRARRATTCFTSSCSSGRPGRRRDRRRGRDGRDDEPLSDPRRRRQRVAAHRRQGPSRRTRLSSEDLAAASVVILNDVPVAQTTAERLAGLRPARRRAVRRRRRAGDLAVGGRRHPAGPAGRRSSIDRAAHAARLGALEYGHPLFEVFRAPRTGDFRVGALLRLSQRDRDRHPAQPRRLAAVRRRAAGAARATVGSRPRAAVDLDARTDVERPRAQAGVPALRPPHHALSWRVS